MLSCKDATRMMSEAQDRKLETGERLKLEMHLAMCRGCRAFRQQMNFSACGLSPPERARRAGAD